MTIVRFGLDSTSPVPVSAHHAVGSTVALRYLSRSTWKVVTSAEHQADKAAGIDLALVFEDDGRPDLHGYDGGKADAQFALAQSHSILGTPALPPVIRFACDYDASPDVSATDAYYDGVASVIPRERCGPYGGFAVVAHQAGRGFGALWQTYAWSGSSFDSRAQVYQYSNGHSVGGIGVDYDHVYGEDFGQWERKAPAPADPNHYLWFDTSTVPYGKGRISERSAVEQYDRYRQHPKLHPLKLAWARKQCRYLAQSILYDVLKASGNRTQDWVIFHRGWRYKQLTERWQGKQVAGG